MPGREHESVNRFIRSQLKREGYEVLKGRIADIIAEKGKEFILAEVKSSLGSNSFAEGIGQLLLARFLFYRSRPELYSEKHKLELWLVFACSEIEEIETCKERLASYESVYGDFLEANRIKLNIIDVNAALPKMAELPKLVSRKHVYIDNDVWESLCEFKDMYGATHSDILKMLLEKRMRAKNED
jgi:Holliday junction resolvase